MTYENPSKVVILILCNTYTCSDLQNVLCILKKHFPYGRNFCMQINFLSFLLEDRFSFLFLPNVFDTIGYILPKSKILFMYILIHHKYEFITLILTNFITICFQDRT